MTKESPRGKICTIRERPSQMQLFKRKKNLANWPQLWCRTKGGTDQSCAHNTVCQHSVWDGQKWSKSATLSIAHLLLKKIEATLTGQRSKEALPQHYVQDGWQQTQRATLCIAHLSHMVEAVSSPHRNTWRQHQRVSWWVGQHTLGCLKTKIYIYFGKEYSNYKSEF